MLWGSWSILWTHIILFIIADVCLSCTVYCVFWHSLFFEDFVGNNLRDFIKDFAGINFRGRYLYKDLAELDCAFALLVTLFCRFEDVFNDKHYWVYSSHWNMSFLAHVYLNIACSILVKRWEMIHEHILLIDLWVFGFVVLVKRGEMLVEHILLIDLWIFWLMYT